MLAAGALEDDSSIARLAMWHARTRVCTCKVAPTTSSLRPRRDCVCDRHRHQRTNAHAHAHPGSAGRALHAHDAPAARRPDDRDSRADHDSLARERGRGPAPPNHAQTVGRDATGREMTATDPHLARQFSSAPRRNPTHRAERPWRRSRCQPLEVCVRSGDDPGASGLCDLRGARSRLACTCPIANTMNPGRSAIPGTGQLG